MLTVTHTAVNAMLEHGRAVLRLPIMTCMDPEPIAIIAAIAFAAPIVDDIRPLGVLSGSIRCRREIETAVAVIELPQEIRDNGKKIAENLMRFVGRANGLVPPHEGWRR